MWWCRHSALVGSENYYKPYETRIRARNEYGEGKLSSIVNIMSAEEMPNATPRNVYSTPFNATALEVFWTPVPNTREAMRGRLIGYRVRYQYNFL